jgi:calcium-dependent protein kinase
VTFKELVKRVVDAKLQEAKTRRNSILEEKLLRVEGFVERRIVHDYPYTDDYEVREVVGTGACGNVHRGTLMPKPRWTAAQKDVVLKTLRKENLSFKKLEELVVETMVGLFLDHPLICRLLRVYETDADLTLVLEYCSGGDMFERFAALSKYPEPLAQTTCVQMLTALKYLRSQRVVHRDIKLENWLYAPAEEESPLLITDFGFAAYYDESVDEPLASMVGSSFYIAPEVLRQSYGHQCDMWSVGVTTYMLISGIAPFGGDDVNEIFGSVLTGQLSFPREFFAGTSAEAQSFLRYLLSRDVSKRPGPCDALEHPWLARLNRAGRLPRELRDVSVDSLVVFAGQPDLRRAALVVMGGGASSAIFRDARRAFLDLDLTGSGTISFDSFKQHLIERSPDIDQVLIVELFKKLDVYKHGEIHYSQFIAAQEGAGLVENADAISRAFAVFDSDKSGFISTENLRDIFKGQLSQEKELLEIEQMLQEAGCSDIRGMRLDEFTTMVKNPRPVERWASLIRNPRPSTNGTHRP